MIAFSLSCLIFHQSLISGETIRLFIFCHLFRKLAHKRKYSHNKNLPVSWKIYGVHFLSRPTLISMKFMDFPGFFERGQYYPCQFYYLYVCFIFQFSFWPRISRFISELGCSRSEKIKLISEEYQYSIKSGYNPLWQG